MSQFGKGFCFLNLAVSGLVWSTNVSYKVSAQLPEEKYQKK